MAKHKRKHHSGAMNGTMRIAHDRRGHAMGEHFGRRDEGFTERMDLDKKMRIMRPNNGTRGPISEDFSRPCGLPYGAIQRDLGNGDYFSMNGYRVGDLYEQVEKTMRADAAALKTITKPTNW